VDRVLVNADTQESVRLLNDRMAYVAVSRAREEALIYTDSAQNLRETLNRGTNKEMALEATRDNLGDIRKDRDRLTHGPLAPQQQLQTEHRLDQSPTHIAPTQIQAPGLAVEAPEIELGGALLL
jgi:hypothetical protein